MVFSNLCVSIISAFVISLIILFPVASEALSLPKGFVVTKVGHCRIVHRQKNAGVIGELEETCREGIRNIYSQLGHSRNSDHPPAEVRIVSGPREMKMVAPPNKAPPIWSGAVAYPNHNMLILPLRNHLGSPIEDLNVVLRHELSHLVLRQTLKGGEVPRWFSEGVAIHQSEKSSIKRHWLVWLAARRERLLPLDGIEDYPQQVVDVNLAYAQAADFVGVLIKEGGWLGVRALIRRVGEGAEFNEAVSYAFGRTLKSFENEWRSDLMSRWQWIPLVTGTGAIWGFIMALFFLAYYVTKKRKKRRLREMAVEEEAVEHAIQTVDKLKKRALPSAPKAKSNSQIPTKIRIDDEIHTLH